MQKIVLPEGYDVKEILIFSEQEALCLGFDKQNEAEFWFYFNPVDGSVTKAE